MREEYVLVLRNDLENLIYYADSVAKILKDNGWPGKAEALEDRYMKLAREIDLESGLFNKTIG